MDVMRLYQKKIRRVKPQVEFNLASVVDENFTSFYKYINNKRGTKDDLHPFFGCRGNIVTKADEKAGVLHVFFASVSLLKTSCSSGTQPFLLTCLSFSMPVFLVIQVLIFFLIIFFSLCWSACSNMQEGFDL